MPAHDIIDNRGKKPVDHLNPIFGKDVHARFAVGYLFLSRLTSAAKRGAGAWYSAGSRLLHQSPIAPKAAEAGAMGVETGAMKPDAEG